MEPNLTNLLNDIRKTLRYREGVEKLADRFIDVPVRTLEQLIEILIENSEYQQLSILSLVIAINKREITHELLIKNAKFVDDIRDAFAPFSYLSEDAVSALLELAESDDISWERQAFAIAMAACLARKFHLKTDSIEKIIRRLRVEIDTPEASASLFYAQQALNEETDISQQPYKNFIIDPWNVLPEERPAKVIASGYTVQRATEKVNRNDPCPCGSGKKYKKCCMAKDEADLLNSSGRGLMLETEGIYKPTKVSDEEFIDNIRPLELKNIVPEKLNINQLYFAFRRLSLFGHYELALQMLLELEDREKENFDKGHFSDLLHDVLKAGDLNLAEKIQSYIKKEEPLYNETTTDFQIYLLKNPQILERFEKVCEKCVREEVDLGEICYAMHDRKFPALFLIFFRAFVASFPNRFLDIDVMSELVQKTRISLDMEEIDDPSFDFWDVFCNEVDYQKMTEKQMDENVKLKNQLKEIQKKVGKTNLELSQKEKEIQKLEKTREELEDAAKKPGTKPLQPNESKSAAEAIEKLRRQTKNLQAEIANQQNIRLDLRQQLQKSRTMISSLLKEKEELPAATEQQSKQLPTLNQLPERIIVPEYLHSFRKQAERLPADIVAKALTAVNGIVLNKEETLNQTTSIETVEDLYRVRLGLNYRLMLRWKPGKFLQALDIIPRSKFETWLRQFNN